MILTLIISLYITVICWSYGSIALFIIQKLTNQRLLLPFIPTCFTGLALIGIFFFYLSLVLPLGGIGAQALLILPVLFYFYFARPDFTVLLILKKKISGYKITVNITLFCCFLLVLIMHSWTINHPDTLNYHAQNIQWIEKYRPIPGIANIYLMYGLQSSWFALCALFSFKFLSIPGFTFINATVLLWFTFFVVNKMNDLLQDKNKVLIYFFPWLALLVMSFWSYTQVRLFATSGSPDFITALYLWLIFYLFVNCPKERSLFLLILFLCFFSLTIKLQALPVILFGLFFYYKNGRKKFI